MLWLTAPAWVPSSQRFRSEIVQWQPCKAIALAPLLFGLHDRLVRPFAEAVAVVAGEPVAAWVPMLTKPQRTDGR